MKQTDIQSQPAVVLMGLGRVGTAAPAVYGPRDRLVIRNHADAILAAGGRLAALVDSSEQRRESAMKKLAVRGGAEVEQVAKISQLRPGCADIVTIATPPQGRLELLSEALDLGPKAVILEKPLTVDLDEAAALLQIAAKARIPLYVCFNRRTDPGMREFTKAVDFTKVRAALFRYGVGLMNYGSHAVDQILQWFGPVAAIQSAPFPDGDADLACVSFRCLMRSGQKVEVFGVPDVNYDMFEIEIYLPDQMLAIKNNGVEKVRWDLAEDLYYPGYAGLTMSTTQDLPLPIGGFVEMYQELFASIAKKTMPTSLCTGDDAYEIQRVLAAVIRSAEENGRVVKLTALNHSVA